MSPPHFGPLLAALLLTAPAAHAEDTAAPAKPLTGFMLADVDGDGRVTLDELTTLLNARYSSLDSDSDGLIASADLQRVSDEGARPHAGPPGNATRPPPPPGGFRGPPPGGFRGPPPGAPGGRPPGPPPGGGDNLASGFPFPRPEDSNEDGFISRAEFVAPATAMLDAWDSDRNGAVTTSEAQSSPTEGDRR